MESSYVLARRFSMTPSTKHCSSIFDLGPLTPKIYSPKLAKKSPISRLVWQIDRRCLRLSGFFSGMADSREPCKMLWADPCCHGNEIRARRGDPVAYTGLFFIYVVKKSWLKMVKLSCGQVRNETVKASPPCTCLCACVSVCLRLINCLILMLAS